MEDRAWYIGCSRRQIAERVILVGDPARVSRIVGYLDEVQQVLPVNRGLMTVTGIYQGVGVTVSAFGMGAPIAAIVMHELHSLGAKIFLRIGTAIALPPVELGDFIIAHKAHRHEGTSNAYAPPDYLQLPIRILLMRLETLLVRVGVIIVSVILPVTMVFIVICFL